jgi:hypothetical protein
MISARGQVLVNVRAVRGVKEVIVKPGLNQ